MTPAKRYQTAITAGLLNESEARLLEAGRRYRDADQAFEQCGTSHNMDEMSDACGSVSGAITALTDDATPAPIAMPEGWEVRPESETEFQRLVDDVGHVAVELCGDRLVSDPIVPAIAMVALLRAAGYAVGEVSDD